MLALCCVAKVTITLAVLPLPLPLPCIYGVTAVAARRDGPRKTGCPKQDVKIPTQASDQLVQLVFSSASCFISSSPTPASSSCRVWWAVCCAPGTPPHPALLQAHYPGTHRPPAGLRSGTASASVSSSCWWSGGCVGDTRAIPQATTATSWPWVRCVRCVSVDAYRQE